VTQSSFHLWWRLPTSEPLVEVAAVCEVVVAPRVDRLYFWALQVGFSDGRSGGGAGAHTGLQWHGRGRRARAVNWGGYEGAGGAGRELRGSVSPLPRFDAGGNTVRYRWEPGSPYRFCVFRAGDAWRSEVTDVAAGTTTVIRDLDAPGPYLVSPVVWSEVFASCRDPSAAVRWSGLEAVTVSGETVTPVGLTVSYQAPENGGCTNTSVATDDRGVLQVTNTSRLVQDGEVVAIPE